MSFPPVTETAINDFAIRSFRDIADGDYINARMTCRAVLLPQFLWASQQAVEKYLKCILLLNRIPAKKVFHDVTAALQTVNASGKLVLDLTQPTREFLERIDEMGRFRYLEVSHWGEAAWLVSLDRTVWELRRFCTLSHSPRTAKLIEGKAAPRVRLRGGYLERVLDGSKTSWTRQMLVWQNGFFGPRIRHTVRPGGWFTSTNAPLPLRPELFPEVDKYVHLPRDVRAYWLKVLRGEEPRPE